MARMRSTSKAYIASSVPTRSTCSVTTLTCSHLLGKVVSVPRPSYRRKLLRGKGDTRAGTGLLRAPTSGQEPARFRTFAEATPCCNDRMETKTYPHLDRKSGG